MKGKRQKKKRAEKARGRRLTRSERRTACSHVARVPHILPCLQRMRMRMRRRRRRRRGEAITRTVNVLPKPEPDRGGAALPARPAGRHAAQTSGTLTRALQNLLPRARAQARERERVWGGGRGGGGGARLVVGRWWFGGWRLVVNNCSVWQVSGEQSQK